MSGILSSTWPMALGGVLFAALVGFLMEMVKRSERARYDMERNRAQLEMLRASFESQIIKLNERLLATEDRWRDANHLLISSQARQLDRIPKEQQLQLSAFIRETAGIDSPAVQLDRNLVFVLTPFHDDSIGTYEAIRTVCNDLGLRALRGDEEFVRGDILPHVLRHLARARLVIANLEGRNPNVYYELGLAHAMDKTTVLLAKAPESVPFDVRAKKLVLYSNAAELKEKLRLELARSLALD